jgi:hypothetical protein
MTATHSHYVLTVSQSLAGVYFSEALTPRPCGEDGRLLVFNHGVEVHGGPSGFSVKTDKKASDSKKAYAGAFYDAIPNQSLLFVISSRFLGALNDLGVTNVQTFPLTVTCARTKKKHDYFIANVLGAVPCVDRVKSDATWHDTEDPPRVFLMRSLALRDTAVRDAKLSLFRVAEHRRVLLVSADLAAALTERKITGIAFRPPEDFGDFRP